jgi:serine/threonine protein kinase
MSETYLPTHDRTIHPAAPPGVSGAADLGNSLTAGTLVGEFRISRIIDEGGFGIVYLAHDETLDRFVAIKEYMPASLADRQDRVTVKVRSQRHADTFAAGMRSFINEARLLAQFDHPSLVKVHRFFQANGTAYMVMPFYEGITLKETLHRLGSPPDEAWLKKLLIQILEALAVIHARECFHRDISPDNILMLSDGRPLLLDFGAARRVIVNMTQALTVILKPGYAPIEQYSEDPNLKQGPWTDLYALASVMYFAITGRPPIPAMSRVMTDPLVPLASTVQTRYSRGFLQAIDAALALKPEDRPQSVAAFRESLISKGWKGSAAASRIEPTFSFPPLPTEGDSDQLKPVDTRSDQSSSPPLQSHLLGEPSRVRRFAWFGGVFATVVLAIVAVVWIGFAVQGPEKIERSEQAIAQQPPDNKPGTSNPLPKESPAARVSGDYEVTAWKAAEALNSGAAYQAYLDSYPDGLFAALARSRLSDLEATAWRSAEQLNSPHGYQHFLSEYPNSALVALAKTRMKQFR